jgi:hypothetical protein
MIRNAMYFLVLPLFFFSVVSSAQAASLYIDPAFTTISRGDSITLSVRLDVDEANEECVNAVDGVITYSDDIVPVDISIGDSIFSMWVEQPVIDKEKHTISFAGGIPNGYCGRIAGDPRLTNSLVKLIFRSPGFSIGGGSGSSTATVAFAPETTAYLNDGFGTKAELAMYGTSIDLNRNAGATLSDPWREAVVTDKIAPEKFSITLSKIPVDNGKFNIIFNTTDKQTGVDHYEVMEEPISKFAAFDWGRADAPWVVTRSPYQLKDQSLNSTIRVKAIDKAGNEYVATLLPDKEMRTISTQDIILAAGAGLIALLLLLIVVSAILSLRRRAKRRKESAVVKQENDNVQSK